MTSRRRAAWPPLLALIAAPTLAATLAWADGPPASAPTSPPVGLASKKSGATGKQPDGTTIVGCELPGTSTVIACLPAGRQVRVGDVLGELDSARFRQQLDAQLREVRRAEAELNNARLTREAAELAAREDQAEGLRERDSLRGEIALAEKERDFARDLLNRRDQASKSTGVDAGRAAARAKLQKIELRLERLRGQLRVLEAHTLPRRAKQAEADLAAARSEEGLRVDAKGQADALAAKMRQQVERSRIVAPAAGMLLHVRPRGPEDEPRTGNLEPGSLVREGQPMFRIVPDPSALPPRR